MTTSARSYRLTALALTASLLVSGCYGPFNLTRRLYTWNGNAGGKWEQEFMFLLLVWAPVYGFTTLADAILFNSLEFWTGNNPVNPPAGAWAPPKIKRVTRGRDEAILTFAAGPEGRSLTVQQFRDDQPGESLLIEQHGARSVASNGQGRVLFVAERAADGRIAIHDATSAQLTASSEDQLEAWLVSDRRARSQETR